MNLTYSYVKTLISKPNGFYNKALPEQYNYSNDISN